MWRICSQWPSLALPCLLLHSPQISAALLLWRKPGAKLQGQAVGFPACDSHPPSWLLGVVCVRFLFFLYFLVEVTIVYITSSAGQVDRDLASFAAVATTPEHQVDSAE